MSLFRMAGILLAAVLLPAAQSLAGDIVITTGPEGGFYHWMGVRLKVALFNDGGATGTLLSSNGSIENLERLDNPMSRASIAMTQGDALKSYMAEHPDFDKKTTVLSAFGKECAFLITHKKKGIQSFSDLKEKSIYAISVGSKKSGPASTFQHLSEIEPALSNTPVANVDAMRALLKIQNPEFTKVRSMLLVQRPRTVSPALEVVLDNPSLYRIVPITSSDVTVVTPAGEQPVYNFEQVRIGFGKDWAIEFETLCTPGLLIAEKDKLGEMTLDHVAKVLLFQRSYIMPRAD